MIKIALHGKFGSGKNAFYDLAVKNYPALNFYEGKFAFVMYQLLHHIQQELGLPRKKDGKFLQFMGSHFRNEYGANFWVDRYFNKDRSHLSEIITDVRFIEEFEECKKRGYVLVKINRKEEDRLPFAGNRSSKDLTERALDHLPDGSFDFVINNNGPIEALEQAVLQVVEAAKKRRKHVS